MQITYLCQIEFVYISANCHIITKSHNIHSIKAIILIIYVLKKQQVDSLSQQNQHIDSKYKIGGKLPSKNREFQRGSISRSVSSGSVLAAELQSRFWLAPGARLHWTCDFPGISAVPQGWCRWISRRHNTICSTPRWKYLPAPGWYWHPLGACYSTDRSVAWASPADIKQPGEQLQSFCVGHRFAGLPAGDCLTGHMHLFRQLLLGESPLGAQFQKDFFGFHVDHHLARIVPQREQKAKQLTVAPILLHEHIRHISF